MTERLERDIYFFCSSMRNWKIYNDALPNYLILPVELLVYVKTSFEGFIKLSVWRGECPKSSRQQLTMRLKFRSIPEHSFAFRKKIWSLE